MGSTGDENETFASEAPKERPVTNDRSLWISSYIYKQTTDGLCEEMVKEVDGVDISVAVVSVRPGRGLYLNRSSSNGLER